MSGPNTHKYPLLKKNKKKLKLNALSLSRVYQCLAFSSLAVFTQQLVPAISHLSSNGMCFLFQNTPRTDLCPCLSFGPLIRCDVPAPRNPSAHSNP